MIISRYHGRPPWALTLVMAYFTISTISITFTSAAALFERQSTTCAVDSSLTACNNGLPSSWCCPPNTSCLKLNNTGTDVVICCPISSTTACQTIQPISCNITLQDPSLFPQTAIHVGDTSLTLQSCGTSGSTSTCCPVGYECNTTNGKSTCQMMASSKSPQSSISSSLASFVTTSVAGSASTMQATAGAISSSPTATASGSGGFSKGAWAAIGVILGLIILAIIGFAVLFYRRKKSEMKATTSSTGAGGGIGFIPISEPIYDPQLAARTDFLIRYRQEDSAEDDGDEEKSKSSTRPNTAKSATLTRDSVQVRKKSTKSQSKRKKPKRESSPTRMVTVKMENAPPEIKSPPPSYKREQPVGILKNGQSPQKRPEVYVPKGTVPVATKGIITTGNASPTSMYSRRTRADSFNTLAVVVDGNGSPARMPRPLLDRGGPTLSSQKYQPPGR